MSLVDAIAARTPLGAITAVSAVSREESQAAGLFFLSASAALGVVTLVGLASVGLLAALEASGKVESTPPVFESQSHNIPYDPQMEDPLAPTASAASPGRLDAAPRDGDDRPVALAPVVARKLPASR